MIPFTRILHYGTKEPNTPTITPQIVPGVLQKQYHNTMYLHQPSNTLYAYGTNKYYQMGFSGLVNEFRVTSTACKRYWLGLFGSIMIDTSDKIYYAGIVNTFPQSGGTTNSWADITSVFTNLGVSADMIKSAHIGTSTRILLNDGRVLCCGSNSYGECGTGVTGPISTLQFVPAFGGDVQTMACNSYGTHYIKNNNNAYFVGRNIYGESGAALNAGNVLVHTPTLTNVAHISTRYECTWWFRGNGDVYWSGMNTEGQAGNGEISSTNTYYPVKNDLLNVVIVPGKFQCPSNLTNSGSIAPIGIYPDVIRNGGLNSRGQVGNGTLVRAVNWDEMVLDNLGDASIMCVARDQFASMVVTTDHQLYACGGVITNGYGLPDGTNTVPELTHMKNMPWY